MEPVDNRQLPSRLWAPGSGQACRKILGFALIPNCELKFGPVHNARGLGCTKLWPPPPRPRPSRRHGAPTTHMKTGLKGAAAPWAPRLGLPVRPREPRADRDLACLLRLDS